MKTLIFVKPNSISPESKKEALRNGFIIIEHTNPLEIVAITELTGLQADDVMMSAFSGLSISENAKTRFANQLIGKLMKTS